jgi:CubicO group peptidase (beta-lactamase class C family)
MNSGLNEDLTFESPPGARFFYNTPAYAILKRVLEGATGKTLDELTRLWLTDPLGMRDTAWRERPAVFAVAKNMTGLVTTPRDLAKLGQLLLDDGKAADGSRVISKKQLDAMLEPTATNPAYGRLWWLNGGAYNLDATAAIARRRGHYIPTAPVDLVAAQGVQDRWLFVVPSRRLLVVRTGQSAPDQEFKEKLWSYLMNAVPAE